jgi:ABC-2 type transport system ATP-binding protein
LIEYLRVRELVTMVASLYPHPLPVEAVLDLTGIAELADHQTNKLSGGQSQRVRVALALIGDTDLLMLDEPTAALDVESRRDFWAAIRAEATQGKTVIFATHYLEEADAYADRIVLIARGRIVADGSPAEIRATVGGRTIQATLPNADPAQLATLPGVTKVDQRGDKVILSCADSDSALWALHGQCPAAHDIEVRAVGIEEAFLALTEDHSTGAEQAIP